MKILGNVMLWVYAIVLTGIAAMLGHMGFWQWRRGFRVAGGLSLGVAILLIVAVIWVSVAISS